MRICKHALENLYKQDVALKRIEGVRPTYAVGHMLAKDVYGGRYHQEFTESTVGWS